MFIQHLGVLGEDPLGCNKESNLLVLPSLTNLLEKKKSQTNENPELLLNQIKAQLTDSCNQLATGSGIGGGISMLQVPQLLAHQENHRQISVAPDAKERQPSKQETFSSMQVTQEKN